MNEIGEFLGWLTIVCYCVSICTFIVKRINTYAISRLPKESTVRQYFMIFMKLIVRYHMYFGIGAGVFAVIHYLVQTSSGETSLVGTILTGAMVLTVLLGIVIKTVKGTKKKSVMKVHRLVVTFVLLLIIIHLIVH